MPTKDIEPTIVESGVHSMRYLHIVVHNRTGVLNRLTALMRRKRYKLHEVSLSFDEEGKAHIIFAVDGDAVDIDLAMFQLKKQHDVIDVIDATDLQDQFFHVYYVWLENRSTFEDFPTEPVDTFERSGKLVGMFRVPLNHTHSFTKFLLQGGHHFRRRILTLL